MRYVLIALLLLSGCSLVSVEKVALFPEIEGKTPVPGTTPSQPDSPEQPEEAWWDNQELWAVFGSTLFIVGHRIWGQKKKAYNGSQ